MTQRNRLQPVAHTFELVCFRSLTDQVWRSGRTLPALPLDKQLVLMLSMSPWDEPLPPTGAHLSFPKHDVNQFHPPLCLAQTFSFTSASLKTTLNQLHQIPVGRTGLQLFFKIHLCSCSFKLKLKNIYYKSFRWNRCPLWCHSCVRVCLCVFVWLCWGSGCAACSLVVDVMNPKGLQKNLCSCIQYPVWTKAALLTPVQKNTHTRTLIHS